MTNKKRFIEFLENSERNFDVVKTLKKFEEFFSYLVSENEFVNLISRKMDKNDYWTKHFLDSLIPMYLFDFNNKSVLDFGTGGGLPGIPLKLVFCKMRTHLLDSKLKKINVIKKIVKKLDLKDVYSISTRLEDMDSKWNLKFDYIVCRSVKIERRYKNHLLRLLKNDGKLILYKSKMMDHIFQFNNRKIHEFEFEEIGLRRIVEITK